MPGRVMAAHRPARGGAPAPHAGCPVCILTAEARGPPAHSHPVLAALVGIGGHTGTEALTVPAPAAPTGVRQAV